MTIETALIVLGGSITVSCCFICLLFCEHVKCCCKKKNKVFIHRENNVNDDDENKNTNETTDRLYTMMMDKS